METFLSKDRPDHHSMVNFKKRGVENGGDGQPILRRLTTIGAVLRTTLGGFSRVGGGACIGLPEQKDVVVN